MLNPIDVLMIRATPGPFHLGPNNTVYSGTFLVGTFRTVYDAELFIKMHECTADTSKILNFELIEARETIKDLREEIDLLNKIDA